MSTKFDINQSIEDLKKKYFSGKWYFHKNYLFYLFDFQYEKDFLNIDRIQKIKDYISKKMFRTLAKDGVQETIDSLKNGIPEIMKNTYIEIKLTIEDQNNSQITIDLSITEDEFFNQMIIGLIFFDLTDYISKEDTIKQMKISSNFGTILSEFSTKYETISYSKIQESYRTFNYVLDLMDYPVNYNYWIFINTPLYKLKDIYNIHKFDKAYGIYKMIRLMDYKYEDFVKFNIHFVNEMYKNKDLLIYSIYKDNSELVYDFIKNEHENTRYATKDDIIDYIKFSQNRLFEFSIYKELSNNLPEYYSINSCINVREIYDNLRIDPKEYFSHIIHPKIEWVNECK